MMEEPFCVLVVEGEEAVEGFQVAVCYRGAEGKESGAEAGGFLPREELGRREAADDYVGAYEVDEDQAPLFEAASVALRVGSFEGEPRAEEMIVGEQVAAQIIEIRDTLSSWEERKGRGLLVDIAEDLLRATKLAAMEEKLQAQIRGGINAYPTAFRLAVGVDARGGSTPFAKAFLECFADHVGGAFNQSDSFSSFVAAGAGLLLSEMSS